MSFKRLDAEDFVVSSDSITSTLWSTGTPTISAFYTSSTQIVGSSGDFYYAVYQVDALDPTAENQFDVAYADITGGGSLLYNPTVSGKSPSNSIYGQYRALILEDENAEFSFGNSSNLVTGSHFWVVSFERARYKESLFPGSFNLTLSGSGGYLHLTDNSGDTVVNTFVGTSRVYQIISGSNGTAYSSDGFEPGAGSYGLLFPELGTVFLNPAAINSAIGVTVDRSLDTQTTNIANLIDAMNAGGEFKLNSQETITSDYVFIRARNSEFNYSENPTFISGSTGEVIYDAFINQPQSYITTVGMYNDSNELLAVAKLSRPLVKDFTKEALVRVKLDF